MLPLRRVAHGMLRQAVAYRARAMLGESFNLFFSLSKFFLSLIAVLGSSISTGLVVPYAPLFRSIQSIFDS